MEQHRCFGCMNVTSSPVCEHCGFPADGNNEAHQLPVGTILHAQYVVGRVLGQGGFGITYLGWDAYLDIPVAIKEYYPNHVVSRECTQSLNVHCITEQVRPQYNNSLERFLREAKALAKFQDDPCIVGIKSFFQENDTAYIVMEYVQGINLAKYIGIRGGRLSVEETLKILSPVMDALSAIHEAGLVHRDISPDNIMLHPTGGAKLLDFGAVRDVENADASRAMARSTEAILKHGFAPLEQYPSRGSLGPWTDVYALCATIYYCLTGRIPEDAPARILSDEPVAWEQIPGLSQRQIDALNHGMAPKAPDRLSSVRELKKALSPDPVPGYQAQAYSPSGIDYQPQPDYSEYSPSPAVPAKPRRKKGMMIGILVAVLVVLIGAGVGVFFGVHFWEKATCTTPQTCVLCGKTKGAHLGHSYTDATCTEDAECKRCGKTGTRARGHSWIDATCQAPKTCRSCGETEGIPAEHSLVAASCTKGEYCKNCGESFGSPLGHDWKAATYTAPKTCRRCNATEGSKKSGYYPTVSGSFDNVTFDTLTTAAFYFDTTYRKCTSFGIEFTPVFRSGVYIKNWKVMYLDSNNKWMLAGYFTLDGETAKPTFRFDTPVDIKGVAVLSQADGGYTFSFYLSVVDLYAS